MTGVKKPLGRRIFFCVIILLLVLLFHRTIVINAGYLLVNLSATELSETLLERNITRIARKYRESYTLYCVVHTNKTKGLAGITDDSEEQIKNMADDERYFFLGGGDIFHASRDPVEVYGIFNCYLYLLHREYPIKISAIAWMYSSGGIDNTRSQITAITPEAFMEILGSVDIDGLSRSSAAKVLGDEWIVKTGYVKKK